MNDHRIGPVTDRLELRALTVDDAEAVLTFNSNPEVMRWTGEPPMTSLQQAQDLLASYPDFDTVGYGRWGCVLKEEQKLIGFCGLKYLHDLDIVDVRYRLLPKYWGRGLATEAALATVQHGFDVLNLDQIIGLVLPQNAASIRVLEKIGMRLEEEFDYDGHQTLRYVLDSPNRGD